METHMAEETRDQEEGRHPEHVDGKEQHAERHAGMTVLNDPYPDRRRNKGKRCVQDDAEQQGTAPDRVKRVQPFRCGSRMVNWRHGMP
jgi:hypothetical protein